MTTPLSSPQTVTEIQALLARHGTEPNRRFGQNFLVDGNLMRRIVDESELDPARDVVLEVGTGTGSLTLMLSDRAARVVTVEADKKLIPVTEEVLAGRANVRSLIADVLAGKHVVAPEVLLAVAEAVAEVGPAARFKLVANLPYSIATSLVMNLLLAEPRPALLVFTVQKEVADRMAAGEDTADYGPVSLVCQALATVETLHDLSPNVFWPKPQVFSTLVRIRPDAARIAAVGNLELFHRVALGLFAHRRKTCLKSLEMTSDLAEFHGRWAALLPAVGIDPQARGDTLTLAQVLALAHAAEETARAK
jgi:16S rRNA (adenine1518-N6/adenine1519-N6)-dimethyltransferase